MMLPHAARNPALALPLSFLSLFPRNKIELKRPYDGQSCLRGNLYSWEKRLWRFLLSKEKIVAEL